MYNLRLYLKGKGVQFVADKSTRKGRRIYNNLSFRNVTKENIKDIVYRYENDKDFTIIKKEIRLEK